MEYARRGQKPGAEIAVGLAARESRLKGLTAQANAGELTAAGSLDLRAESGCVPHEICTLAMAFEILK